jgi:hypothetical protein
MHASRQRHHCLVGVLGMNACCRVVSKRQPMVAMIYGFRCGK